MAVTIYGIRTCDTVKKARTWLDGHGVAHRFVDYRAEGLDPKLLDGWRKQVGWEVLLNKGSTTFKELSDAEKAKVDAASSRALMLAQPTVIKRPVLDVDGRILVGFKPERYDEAFSGK